jgi:hypothetical protein
MPTTVANFWRKYFGNYDVTGNGMKSIPFSKQDMRALCDALSSNLEAHDQWLGLR